MGIRLTLGTILAVLATASGQQQSVSDPRSAQNRQADMDALLATLSGPPETRETALKNLVRTANEDVATDAVIAMTRLHIEDVKSLALGLIPKLSDRNARNVLAAAEGTRDIDFRVALARAVLQRIANISEQSSSQQFEEGGQSAAGLAAMLLADSVSAGDRDLIGKVTRIRPHDPGIWLALAKSRIASSEDLSLARSVMQDAQAPRWVRLAAAASLAPSNSDAREFVSGALTSFLSTFGQVSAESIVAEAMKQPEGNPNSTKSADFQPGIRMIGILEFLQTPDAERITFQFLEATNQWVRTGLGLVAAMRWPERFLDSRPMHFEERAKLRAALSILHPELLPRVRALVPTAELEEMRSKMMNDGIETAFSLPGNAGLVL
jgi:hypothetical protein